MSSAACETAGDAAGGSSWQHAARTGRRDRRIYDGALRHRTAWSQTSNSRSRSPPTASKETSSREHRPRAARQHLVGARSARSGARARRVVASVLAVWSQIVTQPAVRELPGRGPAGPCCSFPPKPRTASPALAMSGKGKGKAAEKPAGQRSISAFFSKGPAKVPAAEAEEAPAAKRAKRDDPQQQPPAPALSAKAQGLASFSLNSTPSPIVVPPARERSAAASPAASSGAAAAGPSSGARPAADGTPERPRRRAEDVLAELGPGSAAHAERFKKKVAIIGPSRAARGEGARSPPCEAEGDPFSVPGGGDDTVAACPLSKARPCYRSGAPRPRAGCGEM